MLTNRCRRRPIGADQHHPGHPEPLAAEARRARRRLRRRRLPAHPPGLGLRARDAQVQSRIDHRVSRRDGHDPRRARRLLLRAPAMAACHRRTGRALSRGMRPHARNRDPERPGSRKGIVVALAGARPPPDRTGDRALRRPSSAAAGWRRSRCGVMRWPSPAPSRRRFFFSCSARRICARAPRRCCSWPATSSKPARTAST